MKSIRFVLVCLLVVTIGVIGSTALDASMTDSINENSTGAATTTTTSTTPPIEKFWDFEDVEELRPKELWWQDAQRAINEKLKQSRQQNRNVAKNVIFFIGDGLSPDTVAAARIFEGQRRGIIGERNRLFFEKFPYTGLAKTYCVDRQVADSACTATAYLSGVKANFFTLGVTANVTKNDCAAALNPDNHLRSIGGWAVDAGKSAGLVTTTTVTHASPSGMYVNSAQRMFESDYDVEHISPHAGWLDEPTDDCVDHARQLIENEVSQKFSVILGGGTQKFLPNSTTDAMGNPGQRLDGRNLIKEWLDSKIGKVANFISSRDQLLNLNVAQTDYLFGLFGPGNLDYNVDNINSLEPQPSLVEMTETAIRMLRKNRKGYFLFVEGGRIDHGNHEAKARKALDETIEFAKAIDRARSMTNERDTLIVVSADHGHTLSIAGFPVINNDIVGLTPAAIGDIDHLPYATLSYANGPAFSTFFQTSATGEVERVDLTDRFSQGDYDTVYPHGVPLIAETHGGGDVNVYASGCWEHLFSGVMEQNTLPHLMAYAACIGPGSHVCRRAPYNSNF